MERNRSMRSIRKALYSLVFLGLLTSIWGAAIPGTWKLNVAKSKPSPRLSKESTAVVEERGNDFSVTVTGIGADGKPFSEKYTYPKKGGPVNFSEGGPRNDVSVVCKIIDDHTWENTQTRDGKLT